MRRWNGWGDDRTAVHPSAALLALLSDAVGPGRPSPDVGFDQVRQAVPPSRLIEHGLIETDAAVRVRHARGQGLPDLVALRSGRHLVFPDGVAHPRSTADVQSLLDYAGEHGVALIPWGGGTSVAGHVNPRPGATPVLTVGMERLNALRWFDAECRLAGFEAGVRGPDLEAQLRARGHTLGHFPQSFEYSTLGGWIATRSSGQQSLGYGRIEDLFAGGTILTPRGRLDLPPFPASAAGPDLRHLVLGSEGRLGFIVAATVRLSPLPETERFDAVCFPDWPSGLGAARALAQSGLPLSMIRLSTPVETATNLALAGKARAVRALKRLLALRGVGDGMCLALVGFGGRSRLVRVTRAEALAMARRHDGVALGGMLGRAWQKSRFRLPYLRDTLWELGYAVDTVETATTWEKLPCTLAATEGALRGGLTGEGERVHAMTHLSHFYPTGASLYTTFVFRAAADPDATLERHRALKTAACEAIVRQGATISHQHGVGADHAPYLAAEKGALGMRALRCLIDSVDPQGVLNPGKLLPPREET